MELSAETTDAFKVGVRSIVTAVGANLLHEDNESAMISISRRVFTKSQFISTPQVTALPWSIPPGDPPFGRGSQRSPLPAAAWTYPPPPASMPPGDIANCLRSKSGDNPPPRFRCPRAHGATRHERPKSPWNTGRRNNPDRDDRTLPR